MQWKKMELSYFKSQKDLFFQVWIIVQKYTFKMRYIYIYVTQQYFFTF